MIATSTYGRLLSNTLLPYVCSVPGMLSMEGSRDVKFSGSLGSRVHNKKAGRNTLTGDKAGVLTDAIQTSTGQHTEKHTSCCCLTRRAPPPLLPAAAATACRLLLWAAARRFPAAPPTARGSFRCSSCTAKGDTGKQRRKLSYMESASALQHNAMAAAAGPHAYSWCSRVGAGMNVFNFPNFHRIPALRCASPGT